MAIPGTILINLSLLLILTFHQNSCNLLPPKNRPSVLHASFDGTEVTVYTSIVDEVIFGLSGNEGMIGSVGSGSITSMTVIN